MSPMSLLNMSSEDLQAAHARGQEQRPNSPLGERNDRHMVQWMGLALLMLAPLALRLVG